MLDYSHVLLLSALVVCGVGSYTHSRNPRTHISRVYFMFCIACAYWSVAEFGLRTAQSEEAAIVWARLGALRPLAATLVLHFALVYSGALGRERSAWAHPLLHLPALGMALVDVATLGVSGRPVRHEWGWGRDMTASAPAHMLAVVCYSLIALALLWVCGWFLRHATRARRHEARVLAGTVGAMVLLGIPAYLADLLQPQAFGFTVPLGAVLVVVLTYLISRYNLFQATPQAAAEEILAMMPEGLALVTPEGRVTQCNHALAELWGGTRSGLGPMPFDNSPRFL